MQIIQNIISQLVAKPLRGFFNGLLWVYDTTKATFELFPGELCWTLLSFFSPDSDSYRGSYFQ